MAPQIVVPVELVGEPSPDPAVRPGRSCTAASASARRVDREGEHLVDLAVAHGQRRHRRQHAHERHDEDGAHERVHRRQRADDLDGVGIEADLLVSPRAAPSRRASRPGPAGPRGRRSRPHAATVAAARTVNIRDGSGWVDQRREHGGEAVAGRRRGSGIVLERRLRTRRRDRQEVASRAMVDEPSNLAGGRRRCRRSGRGARLHPIADRRPKRESRRHRGRRGRRRRRRSSRAWVPTPTIVRSDAGRPSVVAAIGDGGRPAPGVERPPRRRAGRIARHLDVAIRGRERSTTDVSSGGARPT